MSGLRPSLAAPQAICFFSFLSWWDPRLQWQSRRGTVAALPPRITTMQTLTVYIRESLSLRVLTDGSPKAGCRRTLLHALWQGLLGDILPIVLHCDAENCTFTRCGAASRRLVLGVALTTIARKGTRLRCAAAILRRRPQAGSTGVMSPGAARPAV